MHIKDNSVKYKLETWYSLDNGWGKCWVYGIDENNYILYDPDSGSVEIIDEIVDENPQLKVIIGKPTGDDFDDMVGCLFSYEIKESRLVLRGFVKMFFKEY